MAAFRPLLILFSTVRKASLNRLIDCRLAHLNSVSYREKLALLPVSRPWTTSDVYLKQSHGALTYLQTGAGSLLGKSALLIELLEVALNSRAIDAEPTGSLTSENALPHRLYYLVEV